MPIAIVLSVVTAILFAVLNLSAVSKSVFNFIIAAVIIVVIVFIYGLIASCCGGPKMKLVLSILFTIISIILIALGVYMMSMKGKAAEIINTTLEKTNETEIINSINKLLQKVGCNDINDGACKKLINHFVDPYFLYLGLIILIVAVVILVGAIFGYWYFCSERKGKVENASDNGVAYGKP